MFALTIVFAQRQWVLLFNEEEAAKNAMTNFNTAQTITDDFGQTVFFNDQNIIDGVMLEDLSKSMHAHVEQALHQTKIMAACEEAARKDPALQRASAQARAAQMMRGNGMPMVGPRIG